MLFGAGKLLLLPCWSQNEPPVKNKEQISFKPTKTSFETRQRALCPKNVVKGRFTEAGDPSGLRHVYFGA